MPQGCAAKKRQKAQLPPHSDDYNAFIAWMVNKVCMVVAFVCYVTGAIVNGLLRGYGYPLRAQDALLSFSELSSCQMPGVLPGLADPCPAVPLGVSDL